MSEAVPAGTKVLIVDDSRMVRASIIKHIRDRYQFREEADGEAGWQALVVDPSIDVVLTDIGMPQLDGFGLLERVRNSKLSRLQHIPVVVISGDEEAEVRERARQLGADDFITKGIGATELIARIDSMARLAKARRELEESRAALAQQQSVESMTNVMSDTTLNWHGAQEAISANLPEGGMSVMVIDIDDFDDVVSRYGLKVAELVARKLWRILTTKVHQDDTIAQLGPGRFAVLSPSVDTMGCCAFALRLQKAISRLVMTYRENRLGIAITVGVASSMDDGMGSGSYLVGIATQRALEGARAGGNRVVAHQGEVDEESVEEASRQAVSIDQLLLRLRLGSSDSVRDQLDKAVRALLPLLEIVEAEHNCGLPLGKLQRIAQAAQR